MSARRFAWSAIVYFLCIIFFLFLSPKCVKRGSCPYQLMTNRTSSYYLPQPNMIISKEEMKFWKKWIDSLGNGTYRLPMNTKSRRTMMKNDSNLIHRENMELYLRIISAKKAFYFDVLVPSLKYFWPGKVPLFVVIDAESKNEREFGKQLAENYPFPRIEYSYPISSNVYDNNGHGRMQRDFFYPENFSTKEYVGYIDTDTMFVTTVTKDLLFEDGKPIVIGIYGESLIEFWSSAAITTWTIFKTKEVMKCMSFFPVIIKVEHITYLRKFLEHFHQLPFDKVFEKYYKLSHARFAQFNLICQYIWLFHRNEYKFYFQLRPTFPDGRWKGGLGHQSPGRADLHYYQKNIKSGQTYPKPRTSIHYKYHNGWKENKEYKRILQSGICYSGGFHICPDRCKQFNNSALHRELFLFEWSDWTWDQRCYEAQKTHYKTVLNELYKSPLRIKQITEACRQIWNSSFSLL